jgi:Xaa-Pro aminopeptidase
MEPHFLDARRERAAAAWDLDDEVVLIGAGDAIPIPGQGDQLYPFKAHPEYFYLADRQRPGSVLAFDPGDGWVHFVPEVSREERVWTGGGEEVGGRPAGELEGWLAARAGRPRAVLGAGVEGAAPDEALSDRLRHRLAAVRRRKDAVELERMREAARITTEAYAQVPGWIRPGITERRLKIDLEHAFLRAGGDGTAYDSIVGFGTDAAVLHFEPTQRTLRDGELVLIDAGAELRRYACDVTRTYPAGGAFTPEQRDLYAVVLEAQKAAVAGCRAGREFRDLHLDTSVRLARGLVDFGVLRGDAESLVERDAHALFFPHGLGHMVGLGVRDVHDRLPDRERSDRPGLENLRLDMPLEPGFTVTIEPGLYFIPALLGDPEERRRHAEAVDWERVDGLLDFGGIRIEDNVVVTGGDPEVLTSGIPKDL